METKLYQNKYKSIKAIMFGLVQRMVRESQKDHLNIKMTISLPITHALVEMLFFSHAATVKSLDELK